MEANDVVNEENKPQKRKYTPRQKVDRSKSEDLDRFSISFTEASSGSECRAILRSRFEVNGRTLIPIENYKSCNQAGLQCKDCPSFKLYYYKCKNLNCWK